MITSKKAKKRSKVKFTLKVGQLVECDNNIVVLVSKVLNDTNEFEGTCLWSRYEEDYEVGTIDSFYDNNGWKLYIGVLQISN